MSYDNWSKYKISDLCDVGSSKRIYRREYVEKGISFYRSKEIILKHNNQDVSDSLYISEERFDELNSKFGSPQEGDILLTSVGTLGVPYRVKSGEKFYFKDGNLTWFKNLNDKINSKFLYYWLFSSLGQKAIDDISIGSTQKAITIKGLNTIELSLPPLLEQKAIANILSSLDDKIELNNKINKNLEELAQTLYKRWFVDFEFPNEDGEPYKSSGGEMVETELGLIPKGWEIITLGDILEKHRNKAKPTRDLRLIDLSNMPRFSISLNAYDKGDKLKTNIYKMNKGNILFGSIRPYFGKVGIAPFNGLTTGTIFQFSTNREYDYSMALTIVSSKNFIDYTEKLSQGTKMPIIKWDSFIKYRMPYKKDIVNNFNNSLFNSFEAIIKNVNENIYLLKVREILLPKLMNGEIEVPIEELDTHLRS